MMTRIYTILLIALLSWMVFRFLNYYQRVEKGGAAEVGFVEVNGDSLPGLAQNLAASYLAARDNVALFRRWLADHENSPGLVDPRKAWIQLDYIILVARDNPTEARRLFATVKRRVGPDSPVYGRVQKLARAYE